MCCKEGITEQGGEAFRTDRQKEQTEPETKSNLAACFLFIDSHVCMDESLSVPRAGPHAVFCPQHD